MGSHARRDAGPFSDVDLFRVLPAESHEASSQDGSYLVDGKLVVVSSVGPSAVDVWFIRPEQAVNVIAGLRTGRVIAGPSDRFQAIQARAMEFSWDEQMRSRAEEWARKQMVGWAEEAHKGLEGLRRKDTGRMLNARFGLSWGLARVLIVWHGILLTGDNSFYVQLKDALESAKVGRLLDLSFGVVVDDTDSALEAQVKAGLELYVEVAALARSALTGAEGELVAETVRRISTRA